MNHCLTYEGAYEVNFPRLTRGMTTFIATDGKPRELAPRPAVVDGLVVGYMERSGKKFSAVRLEFEGFDIALKNAVPLDRLRHLGNRRFSADPVVITDELVSNLLDDILAQ